MAVEVGKVYYVKTCNEPIFVIAVRDVPEENVKEFHEKGFALDPEAFGGKEIVGRTPKLTEQGVNHVLQIFLEEEIHSADERDEADNEARQKLMAAMRPKGPRAVGNVIDAEFIPN